MAENKDFFNEWLENSADEEDRKIIDLMTLFNEKGCFYSSSDVENIYQSLKNKSVNGELQDNFDVLNEKLNKLNIKKSLTDKIEIVKTDEFGSELLDASGKNVLVEGEEKEQYFKTVAENIRMKILFRNLLSSDFSRLQDASQNDKLKDEFDNESSLELAIMAGAEGLKNPEERDFLNPLSYEKAQTSGVFDNVKSFFTSNKKVRISDNMFVASHADHSTRFKGLLDVFSNVLSKETTNKLKLKLGNSINFAKKLWQNKYEITSNVAESLANNSLRTVVGIGASLAVTASVGTFWAIPAVAAYGAYSWASGKIWPIVQERQKMMKQENDGKKLWGSWLFKKDLWNNKQKWQEAKKRALEKPGYKARVVTGYMSAGVALLTCGGLSLSWSDAFTNGIKAKVGMSLLNTFGASAAQVTEVAHSVSDYRNNKSEENRKNMNSAIYGAVAGLAAAGLGTYFAINRLEGTQAELQNVVSEKTSSTNTVNNVVDTVKNQNANQPLVTDTTKVAVDTVKTTNDTTLVEGQPKAAPQTVIEEQQPKAAPKSVVEEQPKAKTTAPKSVVEEQPKAKTTAPKPVVEEQPKAKATAPKSVVEEQPKAKTTAPKSVVEEQPKAKATAPKSVVPKTIVEEQQPKAAPKTVVEDKSVAEQKISEPMVEEKTEAAVEQKVTPKSDTQTVSKVVEPEFVLPEMNEKEQALFDVLKGRYAESNPDMADKLAAQTLMTYKQSLGNAEFDDANDLMVKTHNYFEENEVDAARKEAYTVESGDNKRLAKLKGLAKSAFNDAENATKKFAAIDKKLQEYIEQHPESVPAKAVSEELSNQPTTDVAAEGTSAAAENVETTTSTEAVTENTQKTDVLDPLNADHELLKLQKQHSDLMKDMVEKQLKSSQLDLDLRKLQLHQDVIDAGKDEAQLKKDLKLWEKLEKAINKLDAELSKLRLGEFDNDAKENLSDVPVENVEPSDKNLMTATENLKKYEHAQLLDKEKQGLLKQQDAIVDKVVREEDIEVYKELPEGEAAENAVPEEKTGREILTEAIENKKSEIREMKAEIKSIRRGTQTEVEIFNVDEYEGSEQQKAAGDMAQDYQKETQTVETSENVSETEPATEIDSTASQAENSEEVKAENTDAGKTIEAEFADNPSKEFHNMEKELIENAVKIDSKDENGVFTVMFTMEDGSKTSVTRTPSGKAIVFQGNKITSFAADGAKQEYTNTGKEFVDSQGKTYNATALVKNLTSQNSGR